MSQPIITVEDLSKRYLVGHQSASGERYTALRDVISRHAGNFLRKTRDMLAGRDVIQGDEVEEFWALKDVSFEVQPGETVGIIGRNGAGKSTLLKVLSRITEPSRGCVRLRGRVASLLEVGTGFHPELTGRENIFLNGAILGMTRAEIKRKFDQIVDFAEVEQFLDTPVKRYSSGMYVRLAFAVAAHLDPEILVVDEVLSVGDVEFQKKCLGKMGEVANRGRTVLFVSHQMNAVERLCSKVIMLAGGCIHTLSDDVKSTLLEYLTIGSGHSGTAELMCDAQYKNPWFTPARVRICDSSGLTHAMPVSNSEDLWFEVEGTIEELNSALVLGYAIFAADGQLLYWSYHTDRPENEWPRLNVGHNVLRGRIPPRLFNEGAYRIEFISGLHFREWLCEPRMDVPAVVLEISGGISESPLYTTRRPGLLSPILDWVVAETHAH